MDGLDVVIQLLRLRMAIQRPTGLVGSDRYRDLIVFFIMTDGGEKGAVGLKKQTLKGDAMRPQRHRLASTGLEEVNCTAASKSK